MTNGQDELTKSLETGAKKLSAVPTKKTNADILAEPVTQKAKDIAPVPNNGTAMAPYMLSVALWTGSIVLTTLFNVKRRHEQTKTAKQMWLSKMIIIGPLAILQGCGIYASLHFIWGFHSIHPLATIGILSLAALTYMSLITMLKLGLGALGTLVALVYMFLQLSVAGGTYPVLLTTHFYQVVHNFVPMTYAVDALRHTISIGHLGQIGLDVVVLLAAIAVLQLIVYALYGREFKKSAMKAKTQKDSVEDEKKALLNEA
jgi:putative membrane protein